MEFNVQEFRDVCARAGFTQAELARIYGVTRQTIYDWRTEKYAPKQLALADRASCTTTALLRNIHAGKLPLDPKLDAEKRRSRVDTIITVVLDLLKKART